MGKKLTYDFVKDKIESVDGYSLISTEYKNNTTKMDIKCSKGHVYKSDYGNFHRGCRCPVCNGKRKEKHTLKSVKAYIESFNYRVISKEYINNKSKLKLECDKDHEFEMRFDNFWNNHRCPICTKKKKYTINIVKDYIEKEGYKLLSNRYINNKTKLKMECSRGHVFKMRFDNFKNQNHRCVVCGNKGTSKPEKEIQKYISDYNLKQINNDKQTILNPNTGYYLELDVYLPDLKKAIEYNGKYWHSLPDARKRDKIKQEECKKMGINLLIINEEKYLNNKKNELSIIDNFIKGEV